jgi:hypothetical protein
VFDSFNELWQYLKDHDAPNWFVIFFSLVIWPPVIGGLALWWSNRKRQNAPGFLVTLTRGEIKIGEQEHPVVVLTFINQTGNVIYLSRAKLKAVQKTFSIPATTSRDMARGWHEIVLATSSKPGAFEHYECILQTDVEHGRAYGAIAVTTPLKDAFYSHHPGLLRRLFGRPKYFWLEYVLLVGEKKYSVKTIY